MNKEEEEMQIALGDIVKGQMELRDFPGAFKGQKQREGKFFLLLPGFCRSRVGQKNIK
jgi:hypothetical protein